MGRPKIQLSDLPNGWDDGIVELGEEGGSDVEMRDLLGISTGTWDRLLLEEEYFLETVLRAREKSHVWWIKHSRKELHNKDFNNKLYEMNMQNRFGWNKKTETELSGKIEIPKIKWADDSE